ncbi:MAG: hypothetical protein K0S37_4336 [Microbacterium sp.]|jgi:hypothetical protein|nr:hypothetical protein [Microbacterium sp.]
MGAFDNGFRLKPDAQPIDGDVFVYDAATDSLRPGGAIPGAVGVTSAVSHMAASSSVEAGLSLGGGATEISDQARVTFTAPASGRILVRMSAWVESPSAAGDLYWYPRILVNATSAEATKPAIRAATVGTGAAQFKRVVQVARVIGGLVAGTVYRVEWQHAATVAGYFVKPDSAAGVPMTLEAVAMP